jgi:acetyltransferase
MDALFYPKRLAVVGVSPEPTNLGRHIVANLRAQGYDGEVLPVGRSGGEIDGLPIARRIADLSGTIDAAAILVPARLVPEVLEECAAKGAKAAYVESGGFAEFGKEGAALSARVLAIARRTGIRIVGPNCLGVINTANGLSVPFARLEPTPRGAASILSQSGGVGISYLQEFAAEGLGVAKFVSLGNKIDVDETDLVPYLAADPETRVICSYLESLPRGREFAEAAARAGKPVLVHKSNRGAMARGIAASHTTALAADDRVVSAALRQAGVVRVDEVREMVGAAKALLLPPMRGPRLAVISRSGGHAVIAADACERRGLVLPPFPPEVIALARSRLRANVIRLANPMDLGDLFDVDAYRRVLEETILQRRYDGLLFLFTYYTIRDPGLPERLIAFVSELSERYAKPIAFCLLSFPAELRRLKGLTRFPLFGTTEEAIAGLATSLDYARRRRTRTGRPARPKVDRARARAVLDRASARGRTHLSADAFDLLAAYGIPTPPVRRATSATDAVRAARAIGFPVAMKIESEDVVHKSDAGGVALGLNTANAVAAAYRRIVRAIRKAVPGARIAGVGLSKMIAGGRELILGARVSAGFGPVVVLGWGGTLVEVLDESVIRPAPVSTVTAREMIAELKGSAVLRGVRGGKAADLPALADAVVRVARLVADHPEIAELDVNPLVVLDDGRGVIALDARARLGGNAKPEER